MSLPTYEEATARPEPWLFIAPYIADRDVANLCLVSKQFYNVFNPVLWFEPTTRLLSRPKPFLEYDKFIKKVWKARQHVRSLVIGLDFRPLGPVDFFAREDKILVIMHGNLIFNWFGSLQRCFPSLKFFLVDGTGSVGVANELWREMEESSLSSHFLFRGDHKLDGQKERDIMYHRGNGFDGATDDDSLAMAAGAERGDSIVSESSFRPVQLSARGCGQLFIPMFFGNKDSFSCLLYLDVSWTKQKFEDWSVLTLPPQLKVLKLQGLGLTFTDITPLLVKFKLRLFSLDLSFNNLTDAVIPWLLANNVLPSSERRQNTGPDFSEEGGLEHLDRYFEDAPAYRERADPTEEQENAVVDGVDFREDDLDSVLSHLLDDEQMRLVRGPYWLPPAGNVFMQQTGLTHLYLSDNFLTSQALKVLLLGTNRLQVLDFGTAEHHRQVQLSKYPYILAFSQLDTVQLLKPSVSQRLESLRVHHSVVTTTPTLVPLGDFYLSESRAVYLSEYEYAEKNVPLWPPSRCLPELNPRIKSLTLTHVPQKSFGLVIDRLKHLIRSAGMQEAYIRRARPADARRGARMLPGLRYLCLEFVPYGKIRKSTTTGPSVSGDADADNFMKESARDFSFFDETTQSPESATDKDFSFFNEKLTEGTPWVPSDEMDKAGVKKETEEDSKLLNVKEALQAYFQRWKADFESECERIGGIPEPLWNEPASYYWTGQLLCVHKPLDSSSGLKF